MRNHNWFRSKDIPLPKLDYPVPEEVLFFWKKALNGRVAECRKRNRRMMKRRRKMR